jgi:hypothetical protein
LVAARLLRVLADIGEPEFYEELDSTEPLPEGDHPRVRGSLDDLIDELERRGMGGLQNGG